MTYASLKIYNEIGRSDLIDIALTYTTKWHTAASDSIYVNKPLEAHILRNIVNANDNLCDSI